ncbi:Uncharacterised protein [Avibacterium volantium]|uniref:Transposase and inactivated derivatives n=1 Tax=Avibacterium volantium TaxID=762 RepID=A0A447SRK2_AVIVO|nr:transposase [Avibacterium volantium]VEB24245.1 Uncharacterised protein [Avibacterium volantium]
MPKYPQHFKQQVLDFYLQNKKNVRLLAGIFSLPKEH